MRRHQLRLGLLLLMAFALFAAACGDSSDSGTATTAAPEGAGGTELVTLVARCRANPDTEFGRCNNLLRAVVDANASLADSGDARRIDLKTISDNADWGDYRTEFELASSAGEAPDIIVSGHEDVGAWSASGIIKDLTGDIGSYPEFGDIIESLWASTELNGSRWGIPQDAEVRPLYFRKDLLSQLGWSDADIASLPDRVLSGEYTFEDMLATGAEAIEAGVVDAGNGYWHRPKNGPDFLYYYYGAGGTLIEDGKDSIVFDSAAALKVYELLGFATQGSGVMVSTRLDGDWTSWNTGVATGQVLFWSGGSWQWADWAKNYVADLGGEEYLFENVGFSAIPGMASGTGQPISLSHPLLYMVSSASDNPDLALLLISKATTVELNTEYAVTSGHLAILNAQLSYEPYTSAEFLSQVSPLLEVTTFLPNSPYFSAWSEAYYLGILAVESGDLDAAGALEVVLDQLQNELGDKVVIKN